MEALHTHCRRCATSAHLARRNAVASCRNSASGPDRQDSNFDRHTYQAIQYLMGSVKILGDLEEARREINEEFRRSIERRSANL